MIVGKDNAHIMHAGFNVALYDCMEHYYKSLPFMKHIQLHRFTQFYRDFHLGRIETLDARC